MTQSSANCMKWNWSSAAAGYVELPLSYIAGDQEEIHQNGRKQDLKELSGGKKKISEKEQSINIEYFFLLFVIFAIFFTFSIYLR